VISLSRCEVVDTFAADQGSGAMPVQPARVRR
jgi:hypothetical protein